MAKISMRLTSDAVLITMPEYTRRLTGWRYWWAKLRGKKTTIDVPAHDITQVGTVFIGPNGEKWLKVTFK